MTLQERLLASAKELVRLLEESQKEHEEKIRERDRKLLCFQVDYGREYKSLAKEVEQREAVPDKPKTRNMCTAIDALKEVFANVASEDILMVLDEFKSEVLENSYYVKR